MKLSAAILLGSTLSKQGFGGDSLHGDKRCALGAARQALGLAVDADRPYMEIYQLYPFAQQFSDCPACKYIFDPIVSLVWHLNDLHRWTRERIAEWVATIEPQEEACIDRECQWHSESVEHYVHDHEQMDEIEAEERKMLP